MPRPHLALILAALALAATCGSGLAAAPETGPAPDPAERTVIDTFAYADTSAARTAWEPMFGSAEVEATEMAGRRCLAMPCTFAGTRIERASWDRAVRVDLSACRGIRFQMYSNDAAPVSHFSIYFRSGDGWYTATFSPEARDRWHTVTVDKRDARVEGRPDGWAKVDTIRISAWRGLDRDTVFHLADLETFGRAADVLVVRAESLIRAGSSEAQGFAEYAGQMLDLCESAGLRAAVASDLDLSADRLKRVRLLILPYNPSLPEPAAAAVTAYLEGGGKMLVFYAMPGPLEEATGIAAGRGIRQKAPGHFASIRFDEGALQGAPAVVEQASWNIHDAAATGHGARVVARWFDADGKDTGLPAVVASDRCVLLTHVLLQDDRARKERMLLAMAGHLAPDLAREAAEARIAAIGRMGPFETFDETSAGIRQEAAGLNEARRREAAAALDDASAKRDVARRLLADGNLAEAMDAADEARRLAVRARCLAQAALAGEHRAIWCHSAFGPTDRPWDDEIRVLAENGFTAIVPNMLWGGVAYYESAVLPVAPEVKEKGDQVAECVAACHKYGVECHVWKVNWNMGSRSPRAFKDRMRTDGRVQMHFDGTVNGDWLCPSHPENRRLEIASMVEVATKYDVAGIHFDYIRYPGRDGCFCPGCRERFEKAIGRKVADWPKDVREDAALVQPWLDFRRAQITAVVEEVHRRVKEARPECRISAAVFRHWPTHRDTVGQDWKAWCEQGLLDFVCPMDYTPSNARFATEVASQRDWAAGVPYYPGIGLTTWPDKTDINRLIDQIRLTREAKTGGFTVFHYGEMEMREVIPLCGLGITRER